jgi:tetratricopeptide (TPR) repeat protein
MQEYSKAEQAFQQAIENGDTGGYINLGILYSDQMQEYSKAEQAYRQAIENGDEDGINQLSWFYFEKADLESKKAALKLLSKLKGCKQVVTNRHTSISIDLWNEDIESAKESAEELFKMDGWLTDSTQADMIDLFLLFLAKGQFNLVDKWLTEFTLKDRLKPLYYTLMYFMQDKYPREYLRMGSELQETVDEMLARVEELKEKYA